MRVRSRSRYSALGRTLFQVWLAVLVAAAVRPAAAAEQAGVDTPADAADGPNDYRIGPEDVLHINVWQNAELSRMVPVRPDGKISLPLVNDIQAGGLTPMQLRDVLKERLAEYVPAAEISVIVGDVMSFNVSVIGKVQNSGRYKLKGPATVLDVLALAGGFQDFADTDGIVILRPEPFFVQGRRTGQSFKRLQFNYKKVISAGGETDNLPIQPGDIVVVP